MKKILWIVLIVVVIGVIYGLTQWFKPHRDIEGEKAQFKFEDKELVTAYANDEKAANTLYLDQVVALSGTVSEVDDQHIKLQSGVYCNGDFSGTTVKEGDKVIVKGRVVSYDELFEEVRLDNTTIVD